MPSRLLTFKFALTFGTTSALNENSISVVKKNFPTHRRIMTHSRKAPLGQLSFEQDLEKNLRNECKYPVLQKFGAITKIEWRQNLITTIYLPINDLVW